MPKCSRTTTGNTLFADRTRPLRLMIEFAPPFMQRAGEDPAAFLQRFEDWGFSAERIDERRRKTVPARPQALLSMPFSDLLLTRT